MPFFHVTSARNRASIEQYGLDWVRMGAARGIAGSTQPEAEGVFVCRDRSEADWFLGFDNGDGPLDVWGVDAVDENALLENGSGYRYLPYRIAVTQLTLVDRDVEPSRPDSVHDSNQAYSSRLILTLDDGTIIEGDQVARRLTGSGE